MTVNDLGEKRIIREIIRPFFNPKSDPDGVGDDCAVLRCRDYTLVSTDRIPHDLTAFAAKLIGYYDLGRYLANLNLSDIIASGGRPQALLLSLALPRDMRIVDLKDFCAGFLDAAVACDSRVLGGDITDAIHFSATATAVGEACMKGILRRSTAQSGDIIFTTRPIGLTPAALSMATNGAVRDFLTEDECAELIKQYKLSPLLDVGRTLAESGVISSCMDNTDGIGNCLAELSEASSRKFIVDLSLIRPHPLSEKVARFLHRDPVEFALSAGADFSLVGTYRSTQGGMQLPSVLQEIGWVEVGEGPWLFDRGSLSPLSFQPWNYFQKAD